MTAWKQSREFGDIKERSRKMFKFGTRAFYYMRGQFVHGKQFKWPAMRFAGLPETDLSKHLYLNWDQDPGAEIQQPRLIATHRSTSLEELAQVQSNQPFNVYGTSRDEAADAANPLKVLSKSANGSANGKSCGSGHPARSQTQAVAGD